MEKAGLTAMEVAKELGISRQRVYQLKNKGLLELNDKNEFTFESVMKRKTMPKLKGGRPSGTFKVGVKK